MGSSFTEGQEHAWKPMERHGGISHTDADDISQLIEGVRSRDVDSILQLPAARSMSFKKNRHGSEGAARQQSRYCARLGEEQRHRHRGVRRSGLFGVNGRTSVRSLVTPPVSPVAPI